MIFSTYAFGITGKPSGQYAPHLVETDQVRSRIIFKANVENSPREVILYKEGNNIIYTFGKPEEPEIRVIGIPGKTLFYEYKTYVPYNGMAHFAWDSLVFKFKHSGKNEIIEIRQSVTGTWKVVAWFEGSHNKPYYNKNLNVEQGEDYLFYSTEWDNLKIPSIKLPTQP